MRPDWLVQPGTACLHFRRDFLGQRTAQTHGRDECHDSGTTTKGSCQSGHQPITDVRRPKEVMIFCHVVALRPRHSSASSSAVGMVSKSTGCIRCKSSERLLFFPSTKDIETYPQISTVNGDKARIRGSAVPVEKIVPALLLILNSSSTTMVTRKNIRSSRPSIRSEERRSLLEHPRIVILLTVIESTHHVALSRDRPGAPPQSLIMALSLHSSLLFVGRPPSQSFVLHRLGFCQVYCTKVSHQAYIHGVCYSILP